MDGLERKGAAKQAQWEAQRRAGAAKKRPLLKDTAELREWREQYAKLHPGEAQPEQPPPVQTSLW